MDFFAHGRHLEFEILVDHRQSLLAHLDLLLPQHDLALSLHHGANQLVALLSDPIHRLLERHQLLGEKRGFFLGIVVS